MHLLYKEEEHWKMDCPRLKQKKKKRGAPMVEREEHWIKRPRGSLGLTVLPTGAQGKIERVGWTDWRQKERGQQRMRCLDSITDSMAVNLGETVADRGAWRVTVRGVAKRRIRLSYWKKNKLIWLSDRPHPEKKFFFIRIGWHHQASLVAQW